MRSGCERSSFANFLEEMDATDVFPIEVWDRILNELDRRRHPLNSVALAHPLFWQLLRKRRLMRTIPNKGFRGTIEILGKDVENFAAQLTRSEWTSIESMLSSCPEVRMLRAWGASFPSPRLQDHAMRCAAEFGWKSSIVWLLENAPPDWIPNLGETLDQAGRAGRLELLRWLTDNFPLAKSSVWAMNWAAAYGHLNVVKWLHFNRPEGCTSYAMDAACKKGHLEVVRFLHEHRSEGCTHFAVDWVWFFCLGRKPWILVVLQGLRLTNFGDRRRKMVTWSFWSFCMLTEAKEVATPCRWLATIDKRASFVGSKRGITDANPPQQTIAFNPSFTCAVSSNFVCARCFSRQNKTLVAERIVVGLNVFMSSDRWNWQTIRCDWCGAHVQRYQDGIHFHNRVSQYDDPWSYCDVDCFERGYADGRKAELEHERPGSLRVRCEKAVARNLADFLKTVPRDVVRRAVFERLALGRLELD